MKKLVSLLLTLIMLVSIIPLSSITASAASNNDGWETVFSAKLHDDKNTNTTYLITMSKRHIKHWIGYTTEVKLEATRVQSKYSYYRGTYQEYNTESYFTSKYNLFGKSTEKEVLENDSKLRKNNTCTYIKNIIGYEEIINKDLSNWNKSILDDYHLTVLDIQAGFVQDATKKALGINSSFISTLTSANGWVNFITGKFSTLLFGTVNLWGNMASNAINPEKIIEKRNTEFTNLYNVICKINNGVAYSIR